MTLNFDLGAAGFPFRLQNSPADAVPHSSWLRARASALEALRRGESVAVLGRVGTGKTLLVHSLGQALCDVTIVDEASALPGAAWVELRASGKPFVMAALPDTDLPLPPVRVTLVPLSAEEVARVVAQRLSMAGRPDDLFEPEALCELAKQSSGLMRLVLALAGAATILAEHDRARRVTRQHVAEAAFMRDVARAGPWPQPDALPEPAMLGALGIT